jgi:hypothetical protein
LHAEIIRIITDVDAEIDAALYRRYTTPFADRSQLRVKYFELKMEWNGTLDPGDVMVVQRRPGFEP